MKTQVLSAKHTAFWALGKADKRVAIAKDIIKQIAIKKIKVKSKIYLTVSGNNFIQRDIQLDKLFKERTCTACALGACFISLVDLGNKLKISDINNSEYNLFSRVINNKFDISVLQNDRAWRDHLRKIFSGGQLSLIESAFECSTFWDDEDTNSWHTVDAVGFGKRHRGAKNRLIAICKNIIQNKGTFKP